MLREAKKTRHKHFGDRKTERERKKSKRERKKSKRESEKEE